MSPDTVSKAVIHPGQSRAKEQWAPLRPVSPRRARAVVDATVLPGDRNPISVGNPAKVTLLAL